MVSQYYGVQALILHDNYTKYLLIMKHKIGDKLYIPSAYFISRGEDDFEGGLAEIDRIETKKHLPEKHCNRIMIGFKENPSAMYNYNYILEGQEEWSKEYSGRTAHPNPDINTPWIQNGDIVNGQIWKGGDVI